tara:strand:- start:12597 stop:13292 length:696 start_codon:yes stop_codon:yes gene_type:complete
MNEVVDNVEAPAEAPTDSRPEWLPEKFKTPEDLVTSYSNLESKLGSSQEEIKANLLQELETEALSSRPATVGDYQVPETVDESLINDNELFQWWANHAFENGYSQEEFESGIAKYAQFADSFQPNLEEEKQQLGDNADARIEAVDLWANKFFPEELGDAILVLGQSAQGIQALEFIMDKVGDSSMVSNSQPSQSVTVEDLQSMMKDERYWNPAKRDKAFIKQVDDGFSKIY